MGTGMYMGVEIHLLDLPVRLQQSQHPHLRHGPTLVASFQKVRGAMDLVLGPIRWRVKR